MTDQKKHLEALHPAYKGIAEALQDGDIERAQTHLVTLGENIQGLDLRLLNDDLAARVSKGSSTAVVAMASKNAPATLKNRNAANSVDGVLVDNITIVRLFESIDFYEAPHVEGRSTNVLFHDCLDMLVKMFAGATPDENRMLKALAERVMLSGTKSS